MEPEQLPPSPGRGAPFKPQRNGRQLRLHLAHFLRRCCRVILVFGSRAEIERGEGSAVVARLSLRRMPIAFTESRPASSSRRLVPSVGAIACLLWGFFDRCVFLD